MYIPLTPLRFLHRAKELFSSKVGIVSGDLRFTYGEFGERCERLADALLQLGLQPGDRAAYLSFNTHQLLEGYYGVVQARGIIMPLNVRLSELEVLNILHHATPKVVFFEADFSAMLLRLRAECPFVSHWVFLGAAGCARVPPADVSYEELIEQGRPKRADIFSYDEMSIAELFYTSGSTGTPKGVMLSHRTLYLHALDIVYQYRDPDKIVDLHTIPMFHANGWGRPHTSVLLGTKQVMVRRYEPTFVFRMIQEHRATDLCLVPTMLNALINSPDRSHWNLTSLRRIMIGGAASSAELVERAETAFPGCECVSGYGLTETSPVITCSFAKGFTASSDQERRRIQAMAGWSIPGAVIRVVDEQMRDVPRDTRSIGEVVTMSDHVMDGYYREPQATEAVMSGGPDGPRVWFHTGDMAVWDESGCIQIVDRKKEIIISGGENISSIEVESAIFAHPAVLECAVVAAPDAKWGEVPAAIIYLKPQATLTESELIAFVEERIGHFKIPRRVEFSTEPLPKTGTGKIRKMLLKERYWQGKEKRVQG
jgi:fatty-acyl-CoA synthase